MTAFQNRTLGKINGVKINEYDAVWHSFDNGNNWRHKFMIWSSEEFETAEKLFSTSHSDVIYQINRIDLRSKKKRIILKSTLA